MELILFVVVIWLGVLIHNLRARVMVLEKKLQAPVQIVQTETHAHQHTQAQVAEPSVAGVHAPMYTPPQAPEPLYDDWLTDFFAWCQTDWLMKLGGALVLLGVAWFVSYAFAHDWIGPMGRIALGLSAGACVMAIGRYRLSAYISQGSIMLTVGATMIVLTLYAAREVYDFFTPLYALALMFGASALLGYTAVAFRYAPLAYANALLAALAPLLVASAEPSVAGLSLYLLVLCAGSVWVVALTGWREVVLLSLLIICMHSAGMFTYGAEQLDDGLLFAFVFAAFYFLAALQGMVRAGTDSLIDVVTAGLAGLYLYVWILGAAAEEWHSLLFSGWAAVYVLGAYAAFRISHVPSHFYVYGAVAVAYVGTATALLLDGPHLVVAFGLEALMVMVAGHMIARNTRTTAFLSACFLVPIVLSLESLVSPAWRQSMFHADSFVVAFMCIVLGMAALYLHQNVWPESTHEDQIRMRTLVGVIGIVSATYLAAYVWLSAHALWSYDTGTFVALLIYALAASALYMQGAESRARWMRVSGGVLFGLVVARLVLVDIWDMALAGRVVTFLVIGTLLMAVAWLERSFAHRHTSS